MGHITNEQKLELVTDPNGQVNLAKLRQFEKKHGIAALERIDHSQIRYKPFVKNFYDAHPEVEAMTPEQVNNLRKELKIYVKGELVANPIQKFSQLLEKCVDPRII